LLKPVTMIGETPAVAVILLGLEVAVYVMVPLPIYVDGVNTTVAPALSATAVPIVGVDGFPPPVLETINLINLLSLPKLSSRWQLF
jgi:hypothetical protein